MNSKEPSNINLKSSIKFFSDFLRLSLTARVSFILVLVAATALGCGWSAIEHSVRFNDLRGETGFGRLPPLPAHISDGRRSPDFYGDWDGSEYDYSNYLDKTLELWNQARGAISENDLWTLRKSLRQVIERTTYARSHGWTSPDTWQAERNSAMDMLDALEALDHGSPLSAVHAYIAARSDYDAAKPVEEIRQKLDEARKDRNLVDNALYLEAAIIYNKASIEGVMIEFNRLAAKYPRSEKREAALFMASVAAMKQSKGFANAQALGAKSAPCPECRDDVWRASRAGFERLLREYPEGRYATDARGWLAYLHLGAGDRAGALLEYYRMLANEKDHLSRREAIISLRLTRHRADDAEMRIVEKKLEDKPRIALVYAYHNIYNYALPPLLRWEEPDEDDRKKTREELERVAAFSTRMMRRYPSLAVEGGFALRLAQANLELDRNRDAAEMARRAQQSGVKGEERAESLFIEGVAEHRLKRYEQAHRALKILVSNHTNSRIIENGRRSLAMVAEDMGDLDAALEQYLALDYRYDVAYFIDVLMAPERLASFIERHPSISQRDELLYALGIRYLRERRWGDARKTFSQVHTTGRNPSDLHSEYGDCGCDSGVGGKENYYSLPPYIIRPQWVEQDLRTADTLERMEKAVDLAEGDEDKAEALYQLASYQYQGTLLFYNPAAWRGNRYYLLSSLDAEGRYRQPGESQTLFRHSQQHDRAARALPAFLEVVHRFPNTRAARDALYTAAVCHERLSNYNDYWRGIYENGGYAGERMVTYKEVKRAYPDYVYPRGTYAWEPATRTVSGGPGWFPPPKPVQRPTRRERAIKTLNTAMTEINNRIMELNDWSLQLHRSVYEQLARVGYILWLIVVLPGLVMLNWRAWHARKALRTELARCKPCPADRLEMIRSRPEVNWFSSKFDGYMNQQTRDEWKVVLTDFLYRSQQLAHDEKGRPVLALNAVLHGAIIVLSLAALVL